jgi:hypothetical protein
MLPTPTLAQYAKSSSVDVEGTMGQQNSLLAATSKWRLADGKAASDGLQGVSVKDLKIKRAGRDQQVA